MKARREGEAAAGLRRIDKVASVMAGATEIASSDIVPCSHKSELMLELETKPDTRRAEPPCVEDAQVAARCRKARAWTTSLRRRDSPHSARPIAACRASPPRFAARCPPDREASWVDVIVADTANRRHCAAQRLMDWTPPKSVPRG